MPAEMSTVQLLDSAVAELRKRLPGSWRLDLAQPPTRDGFRSDAVLTLTAPDGYRTALLVEAKHRVDVRDLPGVLAQLGRHAAVLDAPAVSVLAARYLAPSARRWLSEHNVGYVDATGNIEVRVDEPALYVHVRGLDRDPWRGAGRPRGTLKGPPAAAVVRALVDFAEPVTMLELINRSGASTGATYRVVDFLEREALIEKAPRGPIGLVRWRSLIERWAEDYGFQRSSRVQGFVHPRGLPALLRELRGQNSDLYALSGSHAAHPHVSYASARVAMLYLRDSQRTEELGLRAVDSHPNVLVAATGYEVVYQRTRIYDGLSVVAPSQAAVDLLTAPGRGPEEGHALLDWMGGHETDWRD